MIMTGGKAAERCGLGPFLGGYDSAFDIEWIAYANVGHVSEGKLYALIQNSEGQYRFFVDGGIYSNYDSFENSLYSLEPISYTCPGTELLTGDICIRDYQTYRFEVDSAFVKGPMTFYVAIWDKPGNILKNDSTTFDLCK